MVPARQRQIQFTCALKTARKIGPTAKAVEQPAHPRACLPEFQTHRTITTMFLLRRALVSPSQHFFVSRSDIQFKTMSWPWARAITSITRQKYWTLHQTFGYLLVRIRFQDYGKDFLIKMSIHIPTSSSTFH